MKEVNMIIPEYFVTDEVNEFRKKLLYLISNGEKNFSIDFSKCKFIDSTGLGVLILIHKKCIRINGSLKLFAVNDPSVKIIFEQTRLNKMLKMEN